MSNRLQEKYKEVAELEKQKAELLVIMFFLYLFECIVVKENKLLSFKKSYKAPQVHAMRLGPGHTGNYDIPYGKYIC